MTTLPLPFGRPLRPVKAEDMAARTFEKTLSKIVNDCGSKDAAVATDAGIEATVFSKIISGGVGISWDRLNRLMDVCGSELPLMWMLYQRGYDPVSLRKRESELEQKLREEQEKNAALQQKLDIVTEFARDTGRAAP